MKRKLIIAGIFLALAAAMVLAVVFSVPKPTGTVARNSVTSTPEGSLVVPSPGTDAKFRVLADLPKAKPAATNTAPAALPK